jgi:CubicO group peptidase (beta-lactamase class C family)
MTNKWTRRLQKTLTALLLMHFVVEVTGHHYLYNTLKMTIFKGQLGPGIQEFNEMPNRQIPAFYPDPWVESANYGSTRLSQEALEYHKNNESVSFVVIHRDSLLHEQYWDGFHEKSKSNSFSMAKSIVSLLVGIAIDEGKLESVDKPVYFYLPQYRDGEGEKLTIEHLLTMSSGIDFDEHYLNPFAFPARANYGDDLEFLLTNYKVTEEPGVYYEYKSGNTQILAMLVSGSMRRPLAHLAGEYVWGKIGAEHFALWSLDHEDGMEKAFCCINATARDFARIGKLYKDHGQWNGEQIVDSAYVAASIQPSGTLNKDGSLNTTYGYQWWMGDHKGLDFFFMRGIKGQYVLVVPEKDLIVVRMGRKRDNGTYERPHPDDVYNYLDMGLRMISE